MSATPVDTCARCGSVLTIFFDFVKGVVRRYCAVCNTGPTGIGG